MKLLEDRIRRDGRVLPGGVLQVDSFLNHQMDVTLLEEMGKEFRRLFGEENVSKILTIEASGIGIACLAAAQFRCPVVFAKKSRTSNLPGGVYMTRIRSFTHNCDYDVMVSKDYLAPGDRVLIIDDFLANGEALNGLIEIVRQSGAELVGAGIAIEKAFQPGGDRIRKTGVRVESLARIAELGEDGSIRFSED